MAGVQEKARRLSGIYYNNGLELARVRDLSGAAHALKISVQLDKTNIDARNLLGLVYYETGEVISALREWVISQNLQPMRNPAAGYLAEIQKDQQHLRQLNQTIRLYNESLQQCREGHDDIAAVGLRKVVSRNPKHVSAMLLLALIDLKNGRYGQARRLLQRVQKIDKANPRALVYAQEIEENTEHRTRGSGRNARRRAEGSVDADMDTDLTGTRKNENFRERPSYVGMFNIVFGLLVGMLVVFFVIVPAVRKSANREANEKLIDYTTTIATQESRINELESEVEQAGTTVSQAQGSVSQAQTETEAYKYLIQAYTENQNMEYTAAYEDLQEIDTSLLSTEAMTIYESLISELGDTVYGLYVYAGNNAIYLENYEDAVTNFEKALAIESGDSEVLYSLASAYASLGNNDKARETYQQIIDAYPDTDTAAYAQTLMSELGGSSDSSDTESSDTESSDTESSDTDNNDTENSYAENSDPAAGGAADADTTTG